MDPRTVRPNRPGGRIILRSVLIAGYFGVHLLGTPGCSTIGDGEIEAGPAALAWTPPAVSSEAEQSPNWTGWRGPQRNGQARVAKDSLWTQPFEPRELWRVSVGVGLSGLVTAGQRVFCHAHQGDEEVVSALDASTGEVIWSRSHPTDSWKQPFEAAAITPGPLATPTVVANKLYTVSIHGRVRCFDARSSDVLFDVHPISGGEPDPSPTPEQYRYGHASSPLVANGRLFVHLASEEEGQLVALDAETGAVLWRALPEPVAYTSPVIAEFDGESLVVTRTQHRLVGMDPTSGDTIWSHEAPTGWLTFDCATPLAVGNFVFVTSGFHGTRAVHLSTPRAANGAAGWEVEEMYRTGQLSGYMSSPIYRGGYLYGLHKSGRLVCIEAATGERQWSARKFRTHVSLIGLGGVAIGLDEEGTLNLFELRPDDFRTVGQWEIGTYTWSHPAVDGNRFYFRDGEEAICLEMVPTPTAAP